MDCNITSIQPVLLENQKGKYFVVQLQAVMNENDYHRLMGKIKDDLVIDVLLN